MDVTPPNQGTGSQGDPFQISSLSNLRWLAQATLERNTAGKYYQLVCDIDAAGSGTLNNGAGMETIGAKIETETGKRLVGFEGVFDGCCHTIRSLVINRPSEQFIGLFGYISRTGCVSNVCLADTVVVGCAHVGGLAGMNDGQVENCCVRGTATAQVGFVGLLIGSNSDSGNVLHSCTIGRAVTRNGEVAGGLVGHNEGSVKHCESSTEAFGRKTVGGLIGDNGGSVAICCARARVVGSEVVGGFIGHCGIGNNVMVSDCYSSGNVAGADRVGVLMGGASNEALIRNCYASGTLECQTGETEGLLGRNYIGYGAAEHDGPAHVENCYCDYTFGATQCPGNLKSRATFVGWDFDLIWSIRDGEDYPRLRDCGLRQTLAAALAAEIAVETELAARAALEAEAEKKRREEAQQRERERAEEERRAKAEMEKARQEEALRLAQQRAAEEHRTRELEAKTQELRRGAGKCVLCGKPLTFFQRLSRSEKHPQCSSFAPD